MKVILLILTFISSGISVADVKWDCPTEIATEGRTGFLTECVEIITNHGCVCAHNCKKELRYVMPKNIIGSVIKKCIFFRYNQYCNTLAYQKKSFLPWYGYLAIVAASLFAISLAVWQRIAIWDGITWLASGLLWMAREVRHNYRTRRLRRERNRLLGNSHEEAMLMQQTERFFLIFIFFAKI